MRAIVSVATGQYVTGLDRLLNAFAGEKIISWRNTLPTYSPAHSEIPYAFKAWALKAAHCSHGADVVLWCDACIMPGARPLSELWAMIERNGYWFSRNGYSNDTWTCKEAYPLLGITEEENKNVEHVVATTFGLDLRSAIGRAFLDEYLRLAQNRSFCGPWIGGVGVQHRHDQTAASVIAHRLGMKLTDPPDVFAYRGGEDERTILIADGAY